MIRTREDVANLSTERLDSCLAFVDRLRDDCEAAGKGRELPKHLQIQYEWIVDEKEKSIIGADASTGEYL